MPLQPSSFISSSNSFTYAWKFDVFLSFSGRDTRHCFTRNLYEALRDKGIHTFFDDQELKGGEEITPSLINAIEGSRIAIPIFSKSYASSTFCLDELSKIMECIEGKGRLVLPVFYDVEPRDVRHQRGSYGEDLAKHEKRFKDDKERVPKWRNALRQAANLSGKDFNFGNEYEFDFIEKIVEVISKKIKRVPLYVADYPVGLESQVMKVNSLLNVGSDGGVHMVGIHGIGGIGKTTLAKAVYNSIADQFEDLCFLENVSELSHRHGLEYLQEMVLSKILGEKVCNVVSVSEGIPIIKERLRFKKVLLVLDNVDKHEQFQAIIGRPDWFGSGSRVIITTRNKHLLRVHEVKKVYEVGVLNEKEALELFSWKAFRSEKVDEPCYMDILKKLVTYASGLPLALEVIGSNLFGKRVVEWQSALNTYKKIPDENIQEKLKVSFDALHPQQRNIFLDIACCFNGYELKSVVDILCAHYDDNLMYSIGVLVDKSLVTINPLSRVTLHDLIQDMGREIVRLESPEEPATRSRLWLAEDIVKVLEENKGSSNIQIIHLEFGYNGDVIEWDGHAFRKMENLRTLIINKGRFAQGPKHLPNSLRVLIWKIYPSEEHLPCYFHPKQLVILELPKSCFHSDWLAELLKKKFENMRVLKFDYCERIKRIPNLSCSPKLEELSFRGCDKLIEIDESVGFLHNLGILNAEGCKQLRSVPPLKLPSLQKLYLSKCSSLENFPEILAEMKKMENLLLNFIPLKGFSSSVHNLTGLHHLSLADGGIVQLSNSFFMLPEVAFLEFANCKGLLLLSNRDEEGGEEVSSVMVTSNVEFLTIENCNVSEEFLRLALPMFPRLQVLILSKENFRVLPECIEECHVLRDLHLINCDKLEEIPGIPPTIQRLFVVGCTSLSPFTRTLLLSKKLHEEGQDKTFILPGIKLPMQFEYQRRGTSITFWFRNKFPAISFGVLSMRKLISMNDMNPNLTINGTKRFQLEVYNFILDAKEGGHVYMFNKIERFRDEVDKALSEDEWNCAVISVYGGHDDMLHWRNPMYLDWMHIGVHIIQEKSNMDDIRFTENMEVSQSHTHPFVRQQQTSPVHINDKVHWGSKSSKEISSTSTVNVQGLQEHQCLLTINQHNLEGCESVNKVKGKGMVELACNSNDAEDSGKNPLTEKLSLTEAMSDSYESSIHSDNVDQPVNSLIEIPPQPLDPLAELERVLLGSYDDVSPESTSPTAASSSDIQASEVMIILHDLESSLDNPLESLIVDGEIKHQILDCLSKLGQLEDHIPISLQSVIAQVRDFYEDLIHNFPLIQQALVDYSCLEERRSKLWENLKQAKVKQARIETEVSRQKNEVKELDAEIADLETKLNAAVEKRNELQLATKNGEAEKKKILEDARVLLSESEQVVNKMKSSKHAYRDAKNSKARLEGNLATLKGAFASNKP